MKNRFIPAVEATVDKLHVFFIIGEGSADVECIMISRDVTQLIDWARLK